MKHGFLKHAVHIAALCICLAAGLLMEQDEQWSTGKRYLDMSAYWQWREAGHDAQEGGPAVTP